MPRSSACSYVLHIKGEFDVPLRSTDSISALVGSVRNELTIGELMFAEVFDVKDERTRIWEQAVADDRLSPETLKILWGILNIDNIEVDNG